MNYHIASSKRLDLPKQAQEAVEGKRPRHATWLLSQQLGATIHEPDRTKITLSDRLRSQVFSSRPDHWSMARRLAVQLDTQHLVFCRDETIGIPIASLCGRKRNPPKIAVFIHNIDRPRAKLSLRFAQYARHINLWITNSAYMSEFTRTYFGVPEDRILRMSDLTDTAFFTPGPTSNHKTRPVVASVGLEKRDYQTLAQATKNLDVDVRIAGFSANTKAQRRTFPDVMPKNMSNHFYEARDLVQLYRDADVVAVSLFDSGMCAGITTLMEALACCRPVVVTRSRGLDTYLQSPGIAKVIEPGDAAAMRAVIQDLLDNPAAAQAMAERGHKWALEMFNTERWVRELAETLLRMR